MAFSSHLEKCYGIDCPSHVGSTTLFFLHKIHARSKVYSDSSCCHANIVRGVQKNLFPPDYVKLNFFPFYSH